MGNLVQARTVRSIPSTLPPQEATEEDPYSAVSHGTSHINCVRQCHKSVAAPTPRTRHMIAFDITSIVQGLANLQWLPHPTQCLLLTSLSCLMAPTLLDPGSQRPKSPPPWCCWPTSACHLPQPHPSISLRLSERPQGGTYVWKAPHSELS